MKKKAAAPSIKDADDKAESESNQLFSEAEQRLSQIIEEVTGRIEAETSRIIAGLEEKSRPIIEETTKRAEADFTRMVARTEGKVSKVTEEAKESAAAQCSIPVAEYEQRACESLRQAKKIAGLQMLIRQGLDLKSRLFKISGRLSAAKPVRFISSLIVSGLLALVIFVLIAPQFGFVFLTIMGDSMAPALPAGSVAVVQPVAASNVEVGDIIAHRSISEQGPLVTHRVISVINQEGSLVFQTRGDYNEEPDTNRVASTRLVGKVGLHIPFVGYIFHFIRQPLGYGLLVGLPVLIIYAVILRRIWQQLRPLHETDQQPAV